MADIDTGPRYILGQPYNQGEFPTQSVYPSGMFSAFGRSFMGSLPDIGRRWTSLFDEKETLTEDEFKELVGNRPIEFYPEVDRKTAEFLAWEYDRDEYLAQYESHPIAEFLGMMLPYVADPVSVATLPVGGTSAAKALSATSLKLSLARSSTAAGSKVSGTLTEAASFKQFVKHSMAAGAKVGVASAPLEAALQPSAYGEIRPDILAGTVLGPIIASPLLLAPGYALRRMVGRGRVHAAQVSQPETNIKADYSRALLGYEKETPDVKTPPARPGMGEAPLPNARFNQMFEQYPGGYKRWVRDMAADVGTALDHIKAQGIDPDAPALRNFIARHKEGSAKRAGTTSLEQRFTQLRDTIDFVNGQAAPDQINRLRQAGILEDVQQWRAVVERPGFERTAEDTRLLRQVEAREKELRQLEVHPALTELAEILRKPGFERTAEDMSRLNRFLRQGAEGEFARRIETLRSEYEEAVNALRAVDEGLASRKGRKSEALLQERNRLAERVHELANEQAMAREQLRVADGEVRVEDLMEALDAAALESPAAPSGGQAFAETAARPGADPEIAQLEAFARDFGVDVDEARTFFDSLSKHIEEC